MVTHCNIVYVYIDKLHYQTTVVKCQPSAPYIALFSCSDQLFTLVVGLYVFIKYKRFVRFLSISCGPILSFPPPLSFSFLSPPSLLLSLPPSLPLSFPLSLYLHPLSLSLPSSLSPSLGVPLRDNGGALQVDGVLSQGGHVLPLCCAAAAITSKRTQGLPPRECGACTR